ncbi:hypothetical protein WMY93_024345 [Mugilogobius chulae]|uniref:Sodefrin-like factor n=1 Tax=Mugilogobius chulae TaxID=88201 RepID=A0AAW0N9Q7_9GOBI
MKTCLLLCVALTIALSITSVASLSCHVCDDPTDLKCPSTTAKTCDNGVTQCVSATITGKNSTHSHQRRLHHSQVQRVRPSRLCPASNTYDFSLNVGIANGLGKAVCCNTDNCNNADAAAPTAPAAGTLKCYGCNPLTGACSADLACNTLETKCFNTSVIQNGGSTAIKGYGCSSQYLCDAAAALATLPVLTNIVTIQGAPACCSTANCNVPPQLLPPPHDHHHHHHHDHHHCSHYSRCLFSRSDASAPGFGAGPGSAL